VSEDGARFDSGFDGGGPFRDTPDPGGISLDAALRDFGPAAIDDLIPRVRALAVTLDSAHASGVVHGALHPSKVIVYEHATSLIAGSSSSMPYAAPEVASGGGASARSDQYGLAAITYEWMFGRPIDRPADRPVEVRSMPGVDRATLSKAFTRALAPKPADRFASCAAFCDAVAASVVPELPLLALDGDDDDDERQRDIVEADDPEPLTFDSDRTDVFLDTAADVTDVKIEADENNFTARQSDFDSIDPVVSTGDAAVPSWNPSAAASVPPSRDSQRFGGMALIAATLVGAIFGFAAGYMARPRALQSTPQIIATDPGTDAPVSPALIQKSEIPAAPAAKAPASASARKDSGEPRRDRPQAPEAVVSGRLLVRSTPSGATVTVDGVEKGTTPVAIRDLAIGTRDVTIARGGYITATQKVSLTTARPSRTIDVRLTAQAAAAPASRTTPVAPARPGASTGSLAVESRPVGAAVSINGTARGTTPLTIGDLAPGEYRVTMTLPGFRSFATTVRVVAGERTRAAASLTAQEQE
jgi:serine/threonine protein kinase